MHNSTVRHRAMSETAMDDDHSRITIRQVVHGVKAAQKTISDWYLGRSPPKQATGSAYSPSLNPTSMDNVKHRRRSVTDQRSLTPRVVSGGSSNGGVIMVQDIQSYFDDWEAKEIACSTNGTIAHFLAHEHGCSKIEWSRSGRLLVTASNRGDTFRVWGLYWDESLSRSRIIPLRIFSRGYSSAIVSNCTFQGWDGHGVLAVTSNKGTTRMCRYFFII